MLDNYKPVKNALELDRTLATAEKPVMTIFFSYWCEDTQQVAPALEELARKHGDHLDLLRVDLDEAEEIGKEHSITKTPTAVCFHSGKEVGRIEGDTDSAKYEQFFQHMIPQESVH